VRWAEDGAIPIAHHQVVAICETIRAGLYRIVRLASVRVNFLYSPAPKPFSPFSSSSSNRKFRGTFAAIVFDVRCVGHARVREVGMRV
jgi:hypothetical protein